MAFGQLTTRWRILRSPLDVNLMTVSKVIECFARIQNFCITEDTEDIFVSVVICIIDGLPHMDERGRGYLPVHAETEDLMTIEGNSTLRDAIRHNIMDNGYDRPPHNIARNDASNS